MSADLDSWSRWGLETQAIREEIVGFLRWQPTAFSGRSKDTARFPTPRGWEEASQDMKLYPDPFEDVLGDKSNSNWRVIVGLRCGRSTAETFWAWYLMVRDVDLDEILQSGKLKSKKGQADDVIMLTYAAVYAVATRLEQGNTSPKKHPGIHIFVESLTREHRVALLVQLSRAGQNLLLTKFPDTHALIASAVTGAV